MEESLKGTRARIEGEWISPEIHHRGSIYDRQVPDDKDLIIADCVEPRLSVERDGPVIGPVDFELDQDTSSSIHF